MDCPHCGVENLVGARRCAACGETMMSALHAAPRAGTSSVTGSEARTRSFTGSATPRPPTLRSAADELSAASLWGGGASPAPSVVPAAPAAAVRVLCGICLDSFERSPEEEGAALCPSCRGIPADADRMAPNDVQIHPALGVTAQAGAAARPGEREWRPPQAHQRRRIGGFTAFLGAALVLGAGAWAAHWLSNRPKDVAAQILGDVQKQQCTVSLEPGRQYEARIDSTVRLTVTREEPRAFGGTATKVVDVQQTTLQETSVVVVEQEDATFVMDVSAAGRVTDQHGRIHGEDARETPLYPWEGPRVTVRVRASATRPLVQLDGESVEAGSTVPPVCTLGDLAAPGTTLRVGERWNVNLALPALVDRDGRLYSWSFPADVAFAGRAVRKGITCAAFRVNAILPQRLPQRVDDAFNRRSGRIAGAVWIELATGLVVEAELDVDARMWKDVARIDDDLRVKGRIRVERK